MEVPRFCAPGIQFKFLGLCATSNWFPLYGTRHCALAGSLFLASLSSSYPFCSCLCLFLCSRSRSRCRSGNLFDFPTISNAIAAVHYGRANNWFLWSSSHSLSSSYATLLGSSAATPAVCGPRVLSSVLELLVYGCAATSRATTTYTSKSRSREPASASASASVSGSASASAFRQWHCQWQCKACL